MQVSLSWLIPRIEQLWQQVPEQLPVGKLEQAELVLYCLEADEMWSYSLATEAAKKMITYDFEQVGFSNIVSAADILNTASFKVMERLGMHDWKTKDFIDYYKLERQIQPKTLVGS